MDTGLGEERHEAQFDAVLSSEQVFVFVAQGHHLGHVDLVVGGEHGGRVLAFLQSGARWSGAGGSSSHALRARHRRPDRVHAARLQVRQRGAGAAESALATSSFIMRPSRPEPVTHRAKPASAIAFFAEGASSTSLPLALAVGP